MALIARNHAAKFMAETVGGFLCDEDDDDIIADVFFFFFFLN